MQDRRNWIKIIFRGIVSVLLLMIVNSSASIGQNYDQGLYPEIGKVIPEFALKNIRYYAKENVTNKDLQGKWVILDFFSKWCSSCFASFPKTNMLLDEFKDRVDIILVGDLRRGGDVEKAYEKYREKLKLELPVTYDAQIFEQWKIEYVPFLVWINNKGIVKAVTTSADLTSDNIKSFIEGKTFDFSDRSSAGISSILNSYMYNKPLLIDGNGGDEREFLHRSLLTKWDPTTRQSILRSIDCLVTDDVVEGYDDKGLFQVTGAILEWLYEYAYFGEEINIVNRYDEVFHMPVLKLMDSSLFRYDFQTGEGVYNYSLMVPKGKATRSYLMETMQRDLKNYFGYDVSTGVQKVPYWSLKISEEAKSKLKSKGAIEVVDGTHSGYVLKNVSIQQIIRIVAGYHEQEPPFIDETGIDFNIDLEIDAMMSNLDDIKSELVKQGLILERGEREMPAIVIRDPRI